MIALAIALAVPLLAGAGPAAPQDPAAASAAAFEEGFAAAQELAQRGSWRAASEAWLQLLRDHAGADHVRPRLLDIREALRRASFWAGRVQPDPKALVKGRLYSFDRTTGRIRLAYEPSTLGDFEAEESLLLHPMRFRGPYSIEIEGDREALAQQLILVGMDEDHGYALQVGDRVEDALVYFPHRLLRLEGEEVTELASVDPKERARGKQERAKAKISVTKSSIKLTLDGGKVFEVDRPDEPFGRFGLQEPTSFEKLLVDGAAEAAWIDGLVDAAVQEERQAFDAAWVEPAELAAWEAAPAAAPRPRELGELVARLAVPGPLTAAQAARAQVLVDALPKGAWRQVLEKLDEWGDQGLPRPAAEALRALAWLNGGRFARALPHLAALEDAGGARTLELGLLRAQVLWHSERGTQAVEELRRLLAEHPSDPLVHAQLADLLLLGARPDEARQVVDQGLAAAPGDPELLLLREQVVKAAQGPPWKRSFREETEHFVVTTDIDARTGRLAGREAESMLARLIERFGAPRAAAEGGLELRGTRLFLFSGQAGYAGYLSGVEQASFENTAGVYCLRLHQILAWNVESRDDLFRTLRHEVTHLYLRARLGALPRWLDEGLSVLCSLAAADGGWDEAARSFDSLQTLEAHGGRTYALESFLFASDEAFLAQPDMHYAQAWMLLRFLLGSADERPLFDRLWSALEAEVDPRSALDQALEGVDLAALGARFRAHVEALPR